jgi:hypothetical protein
MRMAAAWFRNKVFLIERNIAGTIRLLIAQMISGAKDIASPSAERHIFLMPAQR